VTPPTLPESDTERLEWADSRTPDAWSLGTNDKWELLIGKEESAAMAEAREIGAAPRGHRDPALDPVYQAGGGEQEGFEQAEADLIDNATHAGGIGNPARDMFSPETETDRGSAVFAEADDYDSTEVVIDPAEGPDDPAAGPAIQETRSAD
jgi:hypothetical protein